VTEEVIDSSAPAALLLKEEGWKKNDGDTARETLHYRACHERSSELDTEASEAIEKT